jgi:hypothetical protein
MDRMAARARGRWVSARLRAGAGLLAILGAGLLLPASAPAATPSMGGTPAAIAFLWARLPPPAKLPVWNGVQQVMPAMALIQADPGPARTSQTEQPALSAAAVDRAFAELQAAMEAEVSGLLKPGRRLALQAAIRAQMMLRQAGGLVDRPQLMVVVDRNPSAQRLFLMLAGPSDPGLWRLVGAARVSTGQWGRKDYYLTPIGVFAHTDSILDFRAAGTFNEHHVRGLGAAGMRVWDFGWHWAVKGWHTDGEGGDIRLMMHATDPDLLERRLGRPASEGCVRVSSSLNRFLDRHGVLDADYERAASQDIRFSALLGHDHEPSPLAGRLLVVIDTSLPADALPTAAGRPAGWPSPEPASVAGVKPEGHG